MSVTFLNRMRKSYRVQLSCDVNFKNDRNPHVETLEEQLTGKTFPLGKRSERCIRDNIAIMYEIIGVTNGKYPAHITVYFGPSEHAHEY